MRELREETNLEARRGRIVGETIDGFRDSRDVYRTRFVQVADVRGEPERCEPHNGDVWRWYRWEALPQPLFAPVASLVRAGFRPDA
jgi:8-oxo-dGTP diphosphatase